MFILTVFQINLLYVFIAVDYLENWFFFSRLKNKMLVDELLVLVKTANF